MEERGQGGPSGLVHIWHGVDPAARNIFGAEEDTTPVTVLAQLVIMGASAADHRLIKCLDRFVNNIG
jgi:hypothetical protein